MADPTSYPSLPSPFQPAFSPPLPLSRPASRQSTRIITPAKTHANFEKTDLPISDTIFQQEKQEENQLEVEFN
ncbi:hypothetical protein PtB15_8B150 [Puccinia triticina]|nr:hypothetical protein PtB15_8B150 [Puccinia triticina]